jgi:hypothetical protein
MEVQEFMIIGCFTPLVKIFLPYFWTPVVDEKGKPVFEKDGKTQKEKKVTCAELLKTPDRIIVDEPMRFLVPRSVGGFSLRLNRPLNVPDNNLVMYLTGDDIGQQIDYEYRIHTETDCYGVAGIPLQPDIQGMLVTSLAGGGDDAEDLLRAEKATALAAHKKAVEISKHRCIRAAKRMFHNMKTQRQTDKEANRGHYVPSPAEYLAAYYLAEQESKEAEEMKAVVDQFSGMMDKIEQKGLGIVR